MKTPVVSLTSTWAGDQTPRASSSQTACSVDLPAPCYGRQAFPDDTKTAMVTSEEKPVGGAADHIVDWDGPDDPECPRNWPRSKKLPFVLVTSSMIFCVSFGSSVFAPSEAAFAAEYGEPPVVGQLGVSLWVFGFCAGPTFFGPASELWGHLAPLAVAMAAMTLCHVPIAAGGSAATVLAARFLAGAFGSGVYAVLSGAYFELYEPIARGVALAAGGVGMNLGATLAPIAGARCSWRAAAWATMLLDTVLLLLAGVFVRETSSSAILRRRARRRRRQTRNWALHARAEEAPVALAALAARYLTKPARMLVREPILVVMTAYLTLVYGILYLAFQAFPRAYQRRGWAAAASELPFAAVALGIVAAFATCAVFTLTWYRRKVRAHAGRAVPEWRIAPMALGAAVLPPALLWFAWSGDVHWTAQVGAGFFVGYGVQLIFVMGIIYLVDVYQQHTNSAMAIHIIVRSLVASSFPLWSNLMYDNLGIAWGTSLLALVCVVMCIAPIVFWCFGARIRSWSRFTVRSER